ncbi:transposase [Chloracidobacterium sp. E]|uniref:Transposase n=1 Tax=Chloracidobacterium sp. N TaxID=2821540 RepID=A0ABX8B584_9BACT|nr:transposase [Chloracidobacterium sp. 2]QUV95810.1 transposase [Chloracidobacterium sp. N]QUV98887.1 transposase [Chloracidobacterium sp. E]
MGERVRHRFVCKKCGLRAHADGNASRNLARIGSGAPLPRAALNLPRLKPEDSGSCYAAACAAVSRTQFRAGSCSPPAGA